MGQDNGDWGRTTAWLDPDHLAPGMAPKACSRRSIPVSYLVGRTGFEPVTSSVSGKADIQVKALQTHLACGYIIQAAPGCPSEIHPPDARLTHEHGRMTAHGQAGTIETSVC